MLNVATELGKVKKQTRLALATLYEAVGVLLDFRTINETNLKLNYRTDRLQ